MRLGKALATGFAEDVSASEEQAGHEVAEAVGELAAPAPEEIPAKAPEEAAAGR
ncbi:hypothetical protein ACFV6E_36320 [Streptomyces sp. NPDC059785]|uniref:hypothetical protein n=1 Tax=unclassified Streptomyces TaxID=2593676 RepID=UPI0036496CD4